MILLGLKNDFSQPGLTRRKNAHVSPRTWTQTLALHSVVPRGSGLARPPVRSSENAYAGPETRALTSSIPIMPPRGSWLRGLVHWRGDSYCFCSQIGFKMRLRREFHWDGSDHFSGQGERGRIDVTPSITAIIRHADKGSSQKRTEF